jgi:hypothetical protein
MWEEDNAEMSDVWCGDMRLLEAKASALCEHNSAEKGIIGI